MDSLLVFLATYAGIGLWVVFCMMDRRLVQSWSETTWKWPPPRQRRNPAVPISRGELMLNKSVAPHLLLDRGTDASRTRRLNGGGSSGP